MGIFRIAGLCVIKFISLWGPYFGQLKSAPSTYASKEPIVFLTGTWNPLSICQLTVGVLEYNPPLFAGDARPHRGPRTRLLDTTCHIQGKAQTPLLHVLSDVMGQ